MLLATHSIDRQLRLYRVSIVFQHLKINIQHLKTINDCSPRDWDGDSLINRSAMCQLSHLELIGPGPEIRNPELNPPFILAVFSYVPNQDLDNAMREEPLSIFSRWELYSAKPKLHPSFEHLTSKKPNVSAPTELAVRQNFYAFSFPLLLIHFLPVGYFFQAIRRRFGGSSPAFCTETISEYCPGNDL